MSGEFNEKVFHCDECGLYIENWKAYHTEVIKFKFSFCPQCGKSLKKEKKT